MARNLCFRNEPATCCVQSVQRKHNHYIAVVCCIALGNSSPHLYRTGSDVVDWLYSHVEGFADRREARKYACNLLKVCRLTVSARIFRANHSIDLLSFFFC